MTHAKLTDNLIKNLKPKRTKYIARDTQLQGFSVIINPSGKKNYRVEAHLGGTGPAKSKVIANVQLMSTDEARDVAGQMLLSRRFRASSCSSIATA